MAKFRIGRAVGWVANSTEEEIIECEDLDYWAEPVEEDEDDCQAEEPREIKMGIVRWARGMKFRCPECDRVLRDQGDKHFCESCNLIVKLVMGLIVE